MSVYTVQIEGPIGNICHTEVREIPELRDALFWIEDMIEMDYPAFTSLKVERRCKPCT